MITFHHDRHKYAKRIAAMNTTLHENELNQRDNASHHSTMKNILKWLVFILFPITAISWCIWFKYNDRIKKPWRGILKAFNILLDEIIDGYYNSKNIGNRVIPECL